MEFILVAAGTFLLCWLADKGFQKLFRSRPQHRSGKAVRLNKLYATASLVLAVLGVAAIFTGITSGWFLVAAGGLLIVIGICLIAYYMSFGVFYDEDGFLLTTFGKKSMEYGYRDILGQQLYNSMGHIVIELYMNDSRTVLLQANMTGVYPFMDKAFGGWLRQTGKRQEDCDFYDPENSCWFPQVGG
ncbi:MAG: hypothetical protein J6Q53_02505 [Oscillospiraceae bacterium]|nr:hypothetical protein [Oscillospiraceae bacterium]